MSEIIELWRLTSIGARENRRTLLPFPVTGKDATASLLATDNGHEPSVPLPLIKRLCEALNAQQISYCHWKSNWKLNRWLAGDGDLDLLVERTDTPRFLSIVLSLGFKQAEPPADWHVPGIQNFYGFDNEAGRWVHLHVHYQLVIGHDLTKNYHLPIETLYLEQATRKGLIPTPSREFEIILFVLRMVLKYSAIESALRQLFRKHTGSDAIRKELDFLEPQLDRARVANLLQQAIPSIDHAFFDACVQSLRGDDSFTSRWAIRQELEKRLQSCARRSRSTDSLLKLGRRLGRYVGGKLLDRNPRKRFVNGGMLVAVIGGDGSGKTTALDGLHKWLSTKFVCRRFHLGKPRRSPVTLLLIVLLRIYQHLVGAPVHPARRAACPDAADFPGYLQLLRWVSAGRDRSRVYLKARRFATNGGIALCDRYPVPQLRLMDGPNIARVVPHGRRNQLIKLLSRMERNYYRNIMQPDVLVVLRVDPETAVRRKTSENEHHVRTRSAELWEQDWNGTGAYVINAAQPTADVVAEAQSLIWSRL